MCGSRQKYPPDPPRRSLDANTKPTSAKRRTSAKQRTSEAPVSAESTESEEEEEAGEDGMVLDSDEEDLKPGEDDEVHLICPWAAYMC